MANNKTDDNVTVYNRVNLTSKSPSNETQPQIRSALAASNKNVPITSIDSPKAFYFPNDLVAYGVGNILRFSIFAYESGGYNLLSNSTGGRDQISESKSSKKVADIYLPEPAGASVSYNPKWNLVENSALLAGGLNYAKDKLRGNSVDAMLYGKQLGLTALAVGLAAKNMKFADINQYAGLFGLNFQEYQEQTFSEIPMRSFSYNFNFVPRSSEELKKISDIIRIFKWASVPGIAFGNTELAIKALTYPNVIQIRHQVKIKGNESGGEANDDELGINPWIQKHQPAVLSKVQIDYGDQQAANLLTYIEERPTESTNIIPLGAPLVYNLSLELTEMTIITKTAINNGY